MSIVNVDNNGLVEPIISKYASAKLLISRSLLFDKFINWLIYNFESWFALSDIKAAANPAKTCGVGSWLLPINFIISLFEWFPSLKDNSADSNGWSGFSFPYHDLIWLLISLLDNSAWHWEQALVIPNFLSISGLGIDIVWSARANLIWLPTAWCCWKGIWHEVHWLPIELVLWNVWFEIFSAIDAWQEVHWPLSNRPTSWSLFISW